MGGRDPARKTTMTSPQHPGCRSGTYRFINTTITSSKRLNSSATPQPSLPPSSKSHNKPIPPNLAPAATPIQFPSPTTTRKTSNTIPTPSPPSSPKPSNTSPKTTLTTSPSPFTSPPSNHLSNHLPKPKIRPQSPKSVLIFSWNERSHVYTYLPTFSITTLTSRKNSKSPKRAILTDFRQPGFEHK